MNKTSERMHDITSAYILSKLVSDALRLTEDEHKKLRKQYLEMSHDDLQIEIEKGLDYY